MELRYNMAKKTERASFKLVANELEDARVDMREKKLVLDRKQEEVKVFLSDFRKSLERVKDLERAIIELKDLTVVPVSAVGGR